MAMPIEEFDIEKHRERLRNMTDDQLLRHGRACRYMADTEKRPESVYPLQLKEARAEWLRRHPKGPF
jgi:hypothetical protein